MATLTERIERFFTDVLQVDPPGADVDLFDEGILDSLAFVELLLHLERAFGLAVMVDDLELENFKSIARIASFIASRASIDPTAARAAAVDSDISTSLQS
jgi:acyl carrier protein